MKKVFFFVSLFLFPLLLSGQNTGGTVPAIEHADTLHGVVLPDPYRWMEDIRSPEVLKFVKDENKKAKASIRKFRRMTREFTKDAKRRQIISQPGRELFERPVGDHIYYTRRKGLSMLHYRRKRDEPEKEELLLNEKEALAGKKGFEMMRYKLSPNQRQIAYSIGHFDSEDLRLYVKRDIHSKKYDEEIRNAAWFEWVNDSTVVYVQVNKQSGTFDNLYVHKVGTPQTSDRLIYEEPDKTFIMSVSLSNSRKYIFIEMSNYFTSETRYFDIDAPNSVKIVSPREHGHKYEVSHDAGDSVFYIKTNLNAPNFKIVTANVHHPDSKNWEIFSPESDYLIKSVKSAGDHLITSEYGDGSMKLSFIEKRSQEKYPVSFEAVDATYSADIVHIDSEKKTVRLKYCSRITPDIYYDYDISTKTLTKLFETRTTKYNKADYVLQHVSVPSYDGTRIPVTIIYNKNTSLDGSAPVQLGVYGAYGDVSLPKFYSDMTDFAFMDRGFIEVYAGVRGGGGVGSRRHIDGSGAHKKNTGYDVIAVAQYLIAEKYTSVGKIHLGGGSAGGLAVGMAANMRPELWGSLSFFAPKLDVLLDLDKNRYQTEWLEFGNPNVKEEFDCMLEWSPYRNVKKQAYPPMQFMIGFNDVNTPPYETFKMVAKLRANRINAAPIYLTTDLKGDHYRTNYKNLLHPCVFKLAVHHNLL